jgi:hypothetical protein
VQLSNTRVVKDVLETDGSDSELVFDPGVEWMSLAINDVRIKTGCPSETQGNPAQPAADSSG